MNKKILLGAGIAAGTLAALSVRKTLRFAMRPQSLGPAAYDTEVRELPVRADEHTLYGELLLPKGKSGPLPTVVCCPGLDTGFQFCKNTIGMCLAMSGFAAYCFDFYGGCKGSKSGGTMLEMSVFTERDDLSAVIEHVKTLDAVDQENLFLLGESQGGCVAGITAPSHRDDVRAMVQYYPAYSIPDDVRKRFASVSEIPEIYKVFHRKIGRVYAEKLLDFDVYQEIAPYDRPVLIIHGDADRVVDVSYGRRAAEVYADAQFVCLPGEDHSFSGKGKLQATKLAFDFFTSHLAGSAAHGHTGESACFHRR